MNPRYAGVDAQSFFKNEGFKHAPMQYGVAEESNESSDSDNSDHDE